MRQIVTDRDLQQVTYSRSHAPDRDQIVSNCDRL